MLTNQVLVSSTFKVVPNAAMQRQQKTIRGDHLVPFLIITGLDKEFIKQIEPSLMVSNEVPNKLPIKTDRLLKWEIPSSVRDTTLKVSQELNKLFNRTADIKNNDTDINNIKMHWERDEYQFISNDWPPTIEHLKLKLKRNRYPILDGFDFKQEIKPIANEVKVEPNMFLKKYKQWKVKNLVPKDGEVKRYRSKGGKAYPVMKRVA